MQKSILLFIKIKYVTINNATCIYIVVLHSWQDKKKVETKGVKRSIFVSYPRGIASHNFIYVKDLFKYIKQKKPTQQQQQQQKNPNPPPPHHTPEILQLEVLKGMNVNLSLFNCIKRYFKMGNFLRWNYKPLAWLCPKPYLRQHNSIVNCSPREVYIY